MKVTVMRAGETEGLVVKATPYAMPKRGVQPEGFVLEVNGAVTADVRLTGGTAKVPAYTYVMLNGASYYLPKSVGHLPAGSSVKIAEEAPKSAPTPIETPTPTSAPTEPPEPATAPAKGRRKGSAKVAA